MLLKPAAFFIKKNSTLPVLKFQLTEGLKRKYNITDDMLEDCAVTFSLYNEYNDVYAIANREASLLIADPSTFEDVEETKYTLAYKFTLRDTAKAGRFLGEFKIDFLGDCCGKITFPVDEKIPVIIQDSITKTTVV